MTPLLAVLEFQDFVFIAGIVMVFTGGAAFTARREVNLLPLQRQMNELQQRLDVILKFHNLPIPTPPKSDLSPDVQLMAKDPYQKIAAIKQYRQDHPGVGLAEAKARIEEFSKTGR